MKTTQKATIGLQGQVKVEVIDHAGKVIEERPWQPNLILDQGLNNLADHHIAQLFEWAVGGTGTSRTREALPTSNNYNLTIAGNLARTLATGGRPFTTAVVPGEPQGDIGKLAKFTTGAKIEGIITAVTDADNAYVRPVGESGVLANLTGLDVVLYSVHQKGLDAEFGARTNDYSGVTGHNKTTDSLSTGKRTMQRTFIFPAQTTPKEVVTGNYSQATATVTRSSGARDFTVADKGKYLHFVTANQGGFIASVTNATTVVLASGYTSAGASGAIELYPGINYGEIGFSHTGTAGDNLNIRVRLEDGSGNSAPIYVSGPTPIAPSMQLRVTYKLDVTVSPITIENGNANISDPTDVMSGNKSGKYTIERLALSSVNNDGTSNLTFTSLEPADPASAGFSPLNATLAVMGGGVSHDRGAGAATVQMTAEPYVADDFTRLYTGTFGVNDAIGTAWWVLGIFDVGSSTFPFAFKFDVKQAKTAEVALNVRFSKTWNRVLT